MSGDVSTQYAVRVVDGFAMSIMPGMLSVVLDPQVLFSLDDAERLAKTARTTYTLLQLTDHADAVTVVTRTATVTTTYSDWKKA